MPPQRHAYRHELPQRRLAIMSTKVGAAPYFAEVHEQKPRTLRRRPMTEAQATFVNLK
jgi:hypothetical protein